MSATISASGVAEEFREGSLPENRFTDSTHSHFVRSNFRLALQRSARLAPLFAQLPPVPSFAQYSPRPPTGAIPV